MRNRLPLGPIAIVLLLTAPPFVLGHAALVKANPGPGDEVVGSPDEIVATFSQDLDLSRSTMVVRDASGAVVAEGPLPGDGPRELRLALPELPAGAYEVRWTSFSAEDGELERGRYSFTVLPAPSPTPASTDTQTLAPTLAPSVAPTSAPATASVAPAPSRTTAPGSDDGGVAALLPIGIAAIVLAAIGAWLLRRR